MKLRLNEFSPFKIANPGSWAGKGESMGLPCRVKAVKEGGSHSNPPGISCWGMWDEGPRPPGCCRVGWGQGCVGVTELVVPPRGSLPIPCRLPFKSSWSLEPFVLQSPHVKKETGRLEQSQNSSGMTHLSHFCPGKALNPRTSLFQIIHPYLSYFCISWDCCVS